MATTLAMPLLDTSLDGWWIATVGELAGMRLPPEALMDLPLRLSRDRFRFGSDEGWVVIHRRASPTALDMVPSHGPSRGRIVPAIVEVAGSSMRLCCDLSGEHRPQEFSAPAGTRRFVATYRRVAMARVTIDQTRRVAGKAAASRR